MSFKLKKHHTHYFIYLILSSIFLLNCAYYNTLFNAKKSYNDGIEIIQKEPEKESHPQANKFFEQTIEKCWKLIELYSDKSKYADDALLYIIKSEYYLGKYTQAKLHANQFISKYPDSNLIPEANLWLGKILLKEDNAEDGKQNLNKSITMTKRSRIRSEAYYELGNIAYENEDYLQAISFFEKALNEDVDEQYAAFVQFYLGQSYFQQNKYHEAIERYKKVEKFSPSLDVEYKTNFNLAVCYTEIGKYQDALKILRKMLTAPRFNNFTPLINSEIARIYSKQNKLQYAIDLYKEVVRNRKPSPGTAIASYNLAQIYENDVKNLDSAVYYYGEVKKVYAKYDSVEKAQNRHDFLAELKNIRDNIKRDKFLAFHLENDRYFRDSLYSAQYDDSVLSLYGQKNKTTAEVNTLKLDTTNIFYRYDIQRLDSVKNVLVDSMNRVGNNDTLMNKIDSALAVVNEFIISKVPKKEQEIEKRKLPEIKEDLKNNEFHLAEFFLIQNQEYDSALYHYKDFLETYEDSILEPKALYSMYYIYSSPKKLNPDKRDSLENILMLNYPNSQFTKEILKKKGLLKEEKEKKDSLNTIGEKYFLKAEDYYSQNQLDSALYWYRTTADLDSNLIWSAKAQLAVAWIYEVELHDINQAIKEYYSLNEAYNLPEFKQYASNKIKKPLMETPLVKDTLLAKQDSSSLAFVAIDSSLHTSALNNELGNGNEREKSTLPSIAKSKQYREWRQYRTNN